MRRALSLRLAIQAAAMKVSANIIVQVIARWRVKPADTPAPFDWQQVLEFAIYGSFNSQLSNIIQFLLEDWFPSTRQPQPDEHALPDVKGPEERRQRDEKRSDAMPVAIADADAAAAWRPAAQASRQPFGVAKWAWLRRRMNVSPDVIWRNLLAKLILDQTVGLFITGSIFITITNIARVPHPYYVLPVIRERVGSLIAAGWHIWPLVALCNFLWVPVRSRVLVAVFVGFGWSIFLSVFAMRK